MKNVAAAMAASVMLLGLAVPVGAQCGTRVGEWAYGPSFAAAGDGVLAVYGSGRVLMVAAVDRPEQPAILGSLTLADLPEGIVLDGDVAFVTANTAGFLAVDVSRPARPELRASLGSPDRMAGLAVVGQTAFVANTGSGLLLLDVSDPAAPTEISRLDLDGSVVDVAVHGELAYLACSDAGLTVVDVSDPSAPTVVASLGGIGRAAALDVSSDGRLVAVTDRYEGDLRLVDVSDPTGPLQVGLVDANDDANDVALSGAHAYLANRTDGLRVYDVTDPAAPVEVASVRRAGQTEGVSVHGSTAYLANHYGGLRLVDVTDPTAAAEVGSLESYPDLKQAAMDGGLAVAAAGNRLLTLDVADPAAPTALASVTFSGYANAVLLDGDLAYVAADYRGLEVVDVADPAAPVVVGTAETCDAYELARRGSTVFVACGSGGLGVVDVSSPAEPLLVGSLAGVSGDTVAATDGVVYMTDYATGLSVVDVSDPAAPSLVSIIPLPRPSHRPKVNGNRLFVPTSRDGVVVLDIANPLVPLEVGRVFPTSYLFGAAPVGDLLFIASIYNGGFVYDVSNPAAAVQLATVDFAVDREGEVNFEGALVMATERDSGLEIFDLQACFDEPPAASFTWRPATPEAGQSVRLTDTSVGTVDTRSWDFGDGGASSERFPTHVWAAAGAYRVTLTVSGARGNASTSRTVTVSPRAGDTPPITDPGDHVFVVAAAAHAPGLEGTSWVTDLVLHNPGAADAHTHLWFMKASQDNSAAEGVAVAVAAGASVAVDDLVSTLFGEENATGAVLVGSDQPLLVTSRTYTHGAAGSFGQFIPGRAIGEAVTAGERVWLVELTRSPDFRTNLGVANPSAASVDVHVSLRRADGSEITTRDLTIPPFGSLQRTDIFGTDVDDAVAVVSSATPGAAYFPYASVVDNRTGDPIMVAPIQPDDLQVIAAAAHVSGLENTEWRTDLEVCNPLAGAVDLHVRMLASGQGNSDPPSVPVTLAAGTCTRSADVLETVFSHEGTAALEIVSDAGAVVASSRTFNTTDDGTFGQFVPGIPAAGVVPTGRVAAVTQLTQDVGDETGFRTNLGFVNRSPVAITVDVALHSASGDHLGDLAVQLLPFEHRQLNRVFRQVTSAAVADGHATVSTSTAGGSFVAYASVVDNTSGDPVYIPAEPVGD